MSESRTPRIVVTLELEGRVDVALDVERSECERFAQWVGADARRRAFVRDAIALAQPRPSDLDDGDAFALITAALEPSAPPADAYEVRAPMGSYQRWTLGRILAAGASGREWIAWALQQSWPQDPAFVDALRVVAEREGIEP